MFISTSFGVAPEFTIAEIVGIAVLATVMTSSPFFIPKLIKEINKASVPLLTVTSYLAYFFM